MAEQSEVKDSEPRKKPDEQWFFWMKTLNDSELRRAKHEFWILSAIWFLCLVTITLFEIVQRVLNVFVTLGWPEHYGAQAMLAFALTYFIPLFVIAPLLSKYIERWLRSRRHRHNQ